MDKLDGLETGQKVIYPFHGVGIVEGIVEREILGEKRKFYAIRIPDANAYMLIPLNFVKERGITPMITREEAKSLFDEFKDIINGKIEVNYNKYRTANTDTDCRVSIRDIMLIIAIGCINYSRGKWNRHDKKILRSYTHHFAGVIADATDNSRRDIEKLITNCLEKENRIVENGQKLRRMLAEICSIEITF